MLALTFYFFMTFYTLFFLNIFCPVYICYNCRKRSLNLLSLIFKYKLLKYIEIISIESNFGRVTIVKITFIYKDFNNLKAEPK